MPSLKFALSKTFPCSYLPDHQERLLFYADELPLSPEIYSILQSNGFRRSESMAYKPHCDDCNECKSIRVATHSFQPSKSQKRLINKCKNFDVRISHVVSENYYPLFEKYINKRHEDGTMYPAEPSQLDSFTNCDWLTPYFVEVYDGDKIIAVGIGDETNDALSAVYTFFDPDYDKYSLGTLIVLKQIDYASVLHKQWLYLGYYIQACAKMNYKTNFKPFQVLHDTNWVEVKSL
ncbi:arginyltransferase [Psychrosphaera haliotis]|uniref:arginyltransferase n=1 Tax=Psychrosphaera haliotis TaxID=555083 RepID=UPI0031E1B06B